MLRQGLLRCPAGPVRRMILRGCDGSARDSGSFHSGRPSHRAAVVATVSAVRANRAAPDIASADQKTRSSLAKVNNDLQMTLAELNSQFASVLADKSREAELVVSALNHLVGGSQERAAGLAALRLLESITSPPQPRLCSPSCANSGLSPASRTPAACSAGRYGWLHRRDRHPNPPASRHRRRHGCPSPTLPPLSRSSHV
jgi:hypothetical protein